MKSRMTKLAATALSALMLFATTGARAAVVDISELKSSFDLRDGDVLTGTTTGTNGLWIADGLTLTFSDLTIICDSYCVQCGGSATIILADGTTNTLTVTGSEPYAALNAGGAGTTLTIKGGAAGTGVLNASGGALCAGIGGGWKNQGQRCGNIVIEGGVITAQGGERSAGIGGDGNAICGDITILGGTITATGGAFGAGIGSGGKNGYDTGCGNITISGGTVTATGGGGAAGIGSGGRGPPGNYPGATSCGDITIAATVTKVTARGPIYYYPLSSGATYPFPPKATIGAGYDATCGTVSIAPELTVTKTDNDTTWIIEGSGPVLSGYAAWAADNGKGEWDEKSDGVYNVFRYVFDAPSGDFGTQITNIVVEGGTAKVMTPEAKNTEGVTVWVVESSDVAGAFATKTNILDAAGTNTFSIDQNATHRFYRLSATLTE